MTSLHDLHSDVVGQILRHVDGPTLAAASCSSPLLRSLASDPALWRRLCLSAWPSLAQHPRLLPLLSRPRRFFSQASPFPVPGSSPSASPAAGSSLRGDKDARAPDGAGLPAEIISAVDIHHGGVPVLSRVVETGTSSSWFLASPFRVDGLDRKDPDLADAGRHPAIDPGELTLSWTVVDPATGRAVNLSSRRPVSVERHWYTGETLVRFAVVVGGCAASAVVTCGEGDEGRVREVVLTVEDLDGRSVSGRESLAVLKAAMEGGRRGAKREEEVAGDYREFLRRRRERRERRVRREGVLDLCCTAFGALMFLTFVMLMLSR